ncbi:hypothetical protein H1P_870020 [Hyella patelloides LEGE 07179]|uniref:Uncharacterized protein n=1 Tax=Hyella patelloides LEGE 07179 TaxID=945734 RepID=A0A563W4Z5_9CYAN|nr:hypothetical protein H1P_870020 [Hyella patelloides LEGE 07179]
MRFVPCAYPITLLKSPQKFTLSRDGDTARLRTNQSSAERTSHGLDRNLMRDAERVL